MTTPPIPAWERDGALRAVAELARKLPHVDADEARRRLERLTAAQREIVTAALRDVGAESP